MKPVVGTVCLLLVAQPVAAQVVEAPVMEAPVMEAPVMEAPVMEAPVMEAPVMPSVPVAAGTTPLLSTEAPPRPSQWFELHGYARMPLNLEPTPRTPFLIDSDYFLSGFAYTRLYEPDWSEVFLSAHYQNYRVKFGLFASLYSDYASPELENQFGIAQASVAADKFMGLEPLSVEAGVFWDRFGYFEPYDTYMFGRTHQGGIKARWSFNERSHVQVGAGVHQAILQQNVGMTPVIHAVARHGIGPATVGAYGLLSFTRDERQLSPIKKGSMIVAGVDAHVQLPFDLGPVYAAIAHYRCDQVLYMAPAIEVLHSRGGRGLAENFLGIDDSENGTGSMWTAGLDYQGRFQKARLRLFGLGTHVTSEQASDMPRINRDDRTYLKWGVEPGFAVTSWVTTSLRYDRVILDMDDQANGFRALSPRVSFPLTDWGRLDIMYSRYFYGDKIQLRPGQVPLEMEPDLHAFKIQAQATW